MRKPTGACGKNKTRAEEKWKDIGMERDATGATNAESNPVGWEKKKSEWRNQASGAMAVTQRNEW